MGGGGNTYDYGFRIYNPSLGKFLSVDPLSKTYPWNSTYAYAENTPIACIDLDGLEKNIQIFAQDQTTCELKPLYFGTPEYLDENDRNLVNELVGENKNGDLELIATNSYSVHQKNWYGSKKVYYQQFNYTYNYTDKNGNAVSETGTFDVQVDEFSTGSLIEVVTGVVFKIASPIISRVLPKFAGKISNWLFTRKVTQQVLSKSERLKIFAEKLNVAPGAKNVDEAIGLINKTLDEVEDTYSGVKKAKGIPDRDDGRMYGILDDKYVTKHADGSVTANTKGNKIEIAKDGSFKILSKDGSKVLIDKKSGLK